MTWFRCVETRPWAPLRLFCLPHAGGSAVFYRSWAKEVGPAVELHTAQYPGRADRIGEPSVTDAHQLARLVAGAMAPLLDRPAALFGHSMGAVLAYEVARLLQERGTPPVHLFASGTRAPHDRDDVRRVAGLDDDAVVAEMIELGGTDAEVLRDPELRELVLPYVRSDFKLIEEYEHRPGPRLAVPVTTIIGDADSHVDRDQAARWSELTDGPSALRVLPGGHFYLVEQQAAVVAEVLRTLEVPAR